MKCYMGHFGAPLDSDKIVQERIEEKQPAMVEFYGDDYIIEDPETTYYYSSEETGPLSASERQLEAEAATAQIKKSDVATAANDAAKAASPKKEPNKTLIYGGLAAVAAIWFMNKD